MRCRWLAHLQGTGQLLRGAVRASKAVVSGRTVPPILHRCLSVSTTSRENTVFWLSSGDIFRNLAFEATLFADKKRFQRDSTGEGRRLADAVLWRSDPCVVIGLNQNAWLEANPQEVEQRGWRLARRRSGGGAVFHDFGNLNVSFVESRSTLDRRRCMEFLQRVLMQHWTHLNVFVGPRFDLWLLPTGLPDASFDREASVCGSIFSTSKSLYLVYNVRIIRSIVTRMRFPGSKEEDTQSPEQEIYFLTSLPNSPILCKL
ncbi:unnamed protein product [Dibothriocephalus latus]|uniref:BPL/LPL catalytic domain-containing protein n=1 Tax=Dibothriocephalus latus TaxID=60516 RepID=A0A3P6U5B3_DIBLA|nr:unnamed protein product [Dibothriocephalus latus]